MCAFLAMTGCQSSKDDSVKKVDLTKTVEVEIIRVHREDADLPYETYYVDVSNAKFRVDKESLDVEEYPVWMILEEEDFSNQNLIANEVGGYSQ